MTKQAIRIGIIGYGNLGRGVEAAIQRQADMELVAIFSRRGTQGVTPLDKAVKVEHVDDILNYQDRIDVMLLCGGSATDLPEQTPLYTKHFNTIDSFDNHSQIPHHFDTVDEVAQTSGKISIISVGWDPGLFSLNRVLAEAILPQGETYTFWGKGLSQGHSDAIRRIEGVRNGVQYTIPSEDAISQVRQGEQPDLSTSDKHTRECYVVLEEGADAAEIEQTIKRMPAYFSDYDTQVHFIDEETLIRDHSAMPHGGMVIRSGQTGADNPQVYEFNLTLGSNPEFTASVLVAYARAAYRLNQSGQKGARTVFDITLTDLATQSPEELRRRFL